MTFSIHMPAAVAGEPPRALPAPPSRQRAPSGQRRGQILEALASMLEEPAADRITTAALAARLGVSEAALYRHFASKAQMFEALIEWIERSVFGALDAAARSARGPSAQARETVTALLRFGEKNRGMARVMVGDALLFENARLLARMVRLFDRIEAQLHQRLHGADGVKSPAGIDVSDGCAVHAGRDAELPSRTDATALASVLTAFALGRLQRFTRSGFRRSPTEHLDVALRLLCV